MNQQMVVDLGEKAVGEILTPPWVTASNMTLLSPSLWLASGRVATGYHYDAPDNMLVQLAGEKEVVLLRPPEVKNLYYVEAQDVEAKVELLPNSSVALKGIAQSNRSSSGHSMIDLTNPAAAKRFPRYSRASGLTCQIKTGDVLYIPSFWHHAVVTQPDEDCSGFSLNLWYTSKRPNSFQDAVLKWGGSKSDLEMPDDWT